MNQSGIEPTEFKVLVRPDKIEEKTQSGIWKPQETVEREQAAAQHGTLIAISPLAFTYETWPEGTQSPKIGDRVAFARYAGMALEGKDNEDYRLMNDKDIAGIWK